MRKDYLAQMGRPPWASIQARWTALNASWVITRIQRPLLRSQRAAERNAQQALIALAHRRREREDVDAYFAHLRPDGGSPAYAQPEDQAHAKASRTRQQYRDRY